MARPHARLLQELRLALLSEHGARSIYGDLARLVGAGELRGVLLGLAAESEEQVLELRRTMEALGARPARRSLRRRVLAAALALSMPVLGRRLVLRICAQASDRAARWYAHLQLYLLQADLPQPAASCGRMSARRRRHASVLEAWIRNA